MNPVLSICLITYNHEAYIRDALNGVFMQKVNFPFELIIADDFSTDGTREIIKEYKDQYPEKIRLIFQEQNVGPARNWMDLITSPVGKYVAYLEGDDYWISPSKLQTQVDFLESNPEYVLSFHSVKLRNVAEELSEDYLTVVPEECESLEVLARFGNYIQSPTILYRNIIESYPNEILQSPLGDYFLYLLLAQHGKIHYINEQMAVYRVESGTWSGRSIYQRSRDTAYTFALLYQYFYEGRKFELAEIFANRITKFVKEFESSLSYKDLEKIAFHHSIRANIFDTLLGRIAQLNSEKCGNATALAVTKVLAKRFVSNIKKRIFR